MPPTDNPLRLQVIDRIVAVLKSIQAGTEYFYSPYDVVKRFAHHLDVNGFPFYMVAADTTPSPPEFAGFQLYDELLAVSVKCYVDLEGDEPTTKLEKCLRDVRKAIMNDQVNGGVGSLATLTLAANVDFCETDSGMLALEGRGYFDQRFVFRITGQWGQI